MKTFVRDLISVWLLLTISVVVGLGSNGLRESPMPLLYAAPDLERSKPGLSWSTSNTGELGESSANLAEVSAASVNHDIVIVDARPRAFYREGHIPAALSLSRDDFSQNSASIPTGLSSDQSKPIIVYCAGVDCQDSEIVADALRRLGYSNVRVFRGGWDEWEKAKLPNEVTR